MKILTRAGSKKRIARDIEAYFPVHSLYIELFFGVGGMYFNKEKAKYNILNDIDSEVYNLFRVIMDDKDAFVKQFMVTPVHQNLWDYWKKNKEDDPVIRAVRFIVLSNFGYFGLPATLKFTTVNTSRRILDSVDTIHEMLFGALFMNCDFRKVIGNINFRKEADKNNAFIYADPPYLDTWADYKFNKKDTYELFDILDSCGIRFAMSEFDHPFVLDEAKRRNLNVIHIKERLNLRNRKNEILITNYDTI